MTPLLEFVRRRPLATAVVVAIAVRCAAFVFAVLWPIADENGWPVSPLLPQRGVDFPFYLHSRDVFLGGLDSVVAAFRQVLAPDGPAQSMPVSAPVLPLLLAAFSYPEKTLPLALAFLAGGIVLVVLWLRWLHLRGVAPAWLLLFAVIPNPIWLSLNISSDLPFALFFAWFYFSTASSTQMRPGSALLSAGVAMAVRPNGLVLPLYLIADTLLWRKRSTPHWKAVAACAVVVLAAGMAFYYAQFSTYVRTSVDVTYFGIPQSAYLAGLISWLPEWPDRALSALALVGAKALYFCGLRPSYGQIDLPLLLMRAAIGVVLLPGLIWAFVRGDHRVRLLIVLFLLPILPGAVLDRYNLPLMPILFYYGALAYSEALGWLRGRVPGAGRV